MESPWFVRALEGWGRASCAVLFMHRFSDDSRARGKHDASRLRKVLQTLHRVGVGFASLDDALATAESPRPGSKLSVSFTVDDGYADFAEWGWPVFREFDCPVSLFVVPNAVEGKCWFWWDKLDWIMRHDTKRTMHLVSGDRQFQATWTNEASRFLVFEQASQWLKQFSPEELDQVLAGYAMHCEREVPSEAPSEYRVLSWSELTVLERQGVRIGAHSMTHPVLSRCDDRRVAWEITESIRAVNERVESPLGVFCYPNGQHVDHGAREWDVLAQAGMPYALTTSGGVLPASLMASGDPNQRYRIPRISYQDDAGRIIREFIS